MSCQLIKTTVSSGSITQASNTRVPDLRDLSLPWLTASAVCLSCLYDSGLVVGGEGGNGPELNDITQWSIE